MRKASVLLMLGALLALPGCISFGAEPPEQLLTLSPSVSVAADAAGEGLPAQALAVLVPDVPQRLNVTRIPVTTGDSSLAYLADAFWVDKPANLFRSVLAETIRANGARLVVSGGELEYAAATQLSGQLLQMDYHAGSRSVQVRYDAELRLPDGRILTRRFEARENGIAAEALAVGAALNRAANAVAAQVSQWVDEAAAPPVP